MAHSAYHANNRPAKIWVIACFLGVAGQVGAVALLSAIGLTKSHGGWAFLLATLPLVVAIFISWKITSRLNRERLGDISTRLNALGFRMSQNPSQEERVAFAAPIAPMMPFLGLKTEAAGIEWFAIEQAAGGVSALIFEHEFTTGKDKQRVTSYHTVVARPAGHPDVREMGLNSSAWFSMARHPLMQQKPKNPALHAPEFADVAKQWSLEGDAQIAARFLVPATRNELSLSPNHEGWFMGAGWVICYYKNTFDAENLVQFLAHSRGVLAR